MPPLVQAFMHGRERFNAATHEVEVSVDKATIAALRANQRIIKAAVKKNLKGPPRWNQRGTSSVYEKETRVMNMGRNEPRGGPPGLFSGILYGGVGGVKRPKKIVGVWVGGVGVGGSLNNFKKNTLEAKYPYFAPAVKSVEPRMPAVYEKAWARAVSKQGGLI